MAAIIQKTDAREAMPRAYPDLHDHNTEIRTLDKG